MSTTRITLRASIVGIGIVAALGLSAGAAAAAEEWKQPARTESAKKSAQSSGDTVERETPFGTVKAKKGARRPQRSPHLDPNLSIERRGESILFRRNTPFGAQVWEKKRSELSADEKKWVEARFAAEKAAETRADGASEAGKPAAAAKSRKKPAPKP